MWRRFITSLVVEDGPIEMASAILYLAGALYLWRRSRGEGWTQYRAASVILLAGGLRELDLHNRVTSAYVFNTRYFVSPSVPTLERAIVISILCVLGIIVIDFVMKGWRPFLEDLQLLETRALCAAVGMFLVLFTVGLDRFQGFLRRNYGSSTTDVVFVMWVVEETLEMFIPLLFIAAARRRAVAAAEPDFLRETAA